MIPKPTIMSEPKRLSTVSPLQAKFHESRKDWTDRDIQLAQVYYLTLIQDRAERTRSNTSNIVTWMIVIPLIFGVIMFFAMIAGAAAF